MRFPSLPCLATQGTVIQGYRVLPNIVRPRLAYSHKLTATSGSGLMPAAWTLALVQLCQKLSQLHVLLVRSRRVLLRVPPFLSSLPQQHLVYSQVGISRAHRTARRVFLSHEWIPLGTKADRGWAALLEGITGVDQAVLALNLCVARHMSLATGWRPRRKEDDANSIGIFGVHMSTIYEEGRTRNLSVDCKGDREADPRREPVCVGQEYLAVEVK